MRVEENRAFAWGHEFIYGVRVSTECGSAAPIRGLALAATHVGKEEGAMGTYQSRMITGIMPRC
jgi:hypothetical protein